LYLSGNELARPVSVAVLTHRAGQPSAGRHIFASERFFCLVYLELALCRLVELPPDLAERIPNCRTIVLQNNPLVSVDPLRGLARLHRLALGSCSLVACSAVLDILPGLLELVYLDVRCASCGRHLSSDVDGSISRDNPCTVGLYLPAPLPTLQTNLEHATYGFAGDAEVAGAVDAQWRLADETFMQGMGDRFFVRRGLWRALAGRQRPTLRLLDGLRLDHERHANRVMLEAVRQVDVDRFLEAR
jgi:hypothetical protein